MTGETGSDSSATSAPMRFLLELTPNRQPIEGSLRVGPSDPLVFTGWIELVAVLESVLEDDGTPDGDAGSKKGPGEE